MSELNGHYGKSNVARATIPGKDNRRRKAEPKLTESLRESAALPVEKRRSRRIEPDDREFTSEEIQAALEGVRAIKERFAGYKAAPGRKKADGLITVRDVAFLLNLKLSDVENLRVLGVIKPVSIPSKTTYYDYKAIKALQPKDLAILQNI